MICPRCSVAEIAPDTNRCELCGYTLLGSKGTVVEASVADEVFETIQRELADQFELQVLVRREPASTVYLARDVADDQLVSLRLIPRQGPVEGPLLHRFTQTGTQAAQFRHPHLLAVRKHGMTHSLLWYSSDVIKSRMLRRLLESGPMPLPKTLELLEQVASGLEYLHRNAVVHGSVGQRTVLVDAEGWVRISDPGLIAAIYRAATPGTGWEALVDLPFAAPELLERKMMGPPADQYSLAAVAYACLAGRPPFSGETVEAIRAERTGPVTPLRELQPDVPSHVETAIERGMRDEPGERFASVLDFVAVMSGAAPRPSGMMFTPAGRQSTTQQVVVVPEGALPLVRRRRGVLVALVALACLVVGIGGYLTATLLGRHESPEWAAAGAAALPPSPQPAAAQPPVEPEPAVPLGQEREPPVPLPEAHAPPAEPSDVTLPPPSSSPFAQPSAPGMLFINATPWGTLYLDGQLIGNTPQANLQVAPGVHSIRVVRDGFVAFERRVNVRSGATVRITDIVLKPISQ